MISSEERYEGDFGVRLEKLRFGVIHKKVGRSEYGMQIAASGSESPLARRDCGIEKQGHIPNPIPVSYCC
jgi:hypothetical protein